MLRAISIAKPFTKRNFFQLANNNSKNTGIFSNVIFNLPKGFEKYYRKPNDTNSQADDTKSSENSTHSKVRRNLALASS